MTFENQTLETYIVEESELHLYINIGIFQGRPLPSNMAKKPNWIRDGLIAIENMFAHKEPTCYICLASTNTSLWVGVVLLYGFRPHFSVQKHFPFTFKGFPPGRCCSSVIASFECLHAQYCVGNNTGYKHPDN